MSRETASDRFSARMRELHERVRRLERRLESMDAIGHEFSDVLTSVLCNTAAALGDTSISSGVRELLEETEAALVRAGDLCRRRTALTGMGAKRASAGRILVVDDDEHVRRVTERILGRAGWETLSVADGAGAIERFRAARRSGTPFDAVVTELHFTRGMDGVEAVGILRDIDPRVRVVVSVGDDTDPALDRLRENGMDGFVWKPFRAEEIIGVLDSVLS